MRTTVDLRLDAYVTNEAEHPPLRAAAYQLGVCLSAASNVKHNIKLNLRNTIAPDPPGSEAFATLLSLGGEVDARQAAFTDIEAYWRREVGTLAARPKRPVYLCTIFRHVPLPPAVTDRSARAFTLERIRRLNLMVAEISQATGAGVIDIDCVLAHMGARMLNTDYLLSGQIGAHAAGDVMVAALLAGGLHDIIRDEWLQKAQQLHGGVRGVLHRQWQRIVRPNFAGAANAAV